MLGDEPNAVRKPWQTASVRWCLVASWPYEQAAGNSSIPAVYKSVNDAGPYLADRFYLPATPRDLRLIERAELPIFGIESKQPLHAFDVVGTSISYPVLSMSFIKMLTMSGIPARWRDRDPNTNPMVIAGGLSYGAPEILAPVVDCWWLGEVEDEPRNPGIGDVCSRIAGFKHSGVWTRDRVACYESLAREFNFLYFPRFVQVHYGYEDRTHVGVGPRPSKQVTGYTSTVPGMRMPFVKRHVRDLDAVAPLDNPPLLYADPAMGAGDLEVGRGCPAWCSFCALCLDGSTEFITRDGVRRLDECVGQTVEVWNFEGWQKAEIQRFGDDYLDEITLVPAFWGGTRRGWTRVRPGRTPIAIKHRATALHRWPLVDGGETHHLALGDCVKAEFTRGGADQEYEAGWVHGYVFGDGCLENSSRGERSNCYAALLWGEKDRRHRERFARLACSTKRGGRGGGRGHADCGRPVCVLSLTDDGRRVRVRMNSQTRLKEYPRDKSSAYVRGFIEGWLDADGVTKYRSDDRARLTTQREDAEQWLRENAAFGGWVLTGHYLRPSLETNFGQRKHALHEFRLSRVEAWKVVSIEKGVIKGGTYCAMVAGDGFFTLASGILTGNTYRQRRRSHIDSGRSIPWFSTGAPCSATWGRFDSPRSAPTFRCTPSAGAWSLRSSKRSPTRSTLQRCESMTS